MKVDLNDMRKEAIAAYERLAKKMNSSIRTKDGPDEFVVANYNVENTKTTYRPHIVMGVNELKEEMNDLRRAIGFLAMVHDDENPKIKDVFSEVFPDKLGSTMTVFGLTSKEE